MANLPKACAQCKTDKNLYHSPKYCTNRIRTWEEEPHVFCLRCLLRHSSYFNNYESYWGYVAKIACPCCRSALFEITHCATGRVRPIDDLLMELHVYEHCCKSACAQLVMERVADSIARQGKLLSLSIPFEKSNYRELELLMVVKRRFLRKPETYAEYQNSVDYEMAWYDWGPFPKCEHCRTEHNIYQCVNKSECKGIFCLRCLLRPVYDARVDNVYCPDLEGNESKKCAYIRICLHTGICCALCDNAHISETVPNHTMPFHNPLSSDILHMSLASAKTASSLPSIILTLYNCSFQTVSITTTISPALQCYLPHAPLRAVHRQIYNNVHTHVIP